VINFAKDSGLLGITIASAGVLHERSATVTARPGERWETGTAFHSLDYIATITASIPPSITLPVWHLFMQTGSALMPYRYGSLPFLGVIALISRPQRVHPILSPTIAAIGTAASLSMSSSALHRPLTPRLF
jgi:hypothetical protein